MGVQERIVMGPVCAGWLVEGEALHSAAAASGFPLSDQPQDPAILLPA